MNCDIVAAVDTLNDLLPCREVQARQLLSLLSAQAPSPPTIVLHGSESTGKSSLLGNVLRLTGTAHVGVESQKCITGRHLLERTVSACANAVEETSGSHIDRGQYAKCENINVLAVHLQRLLEGHGKFVLVFDGIDNQREAPPTLLPALARMYESVPSLTVVLVVESARESWLHSTGIPHVYFPAYSRDEAIHIVSQTKPSMPEIPIDVPARTRKDLKNDGVEWLWERFCTAVWDSLAKGAARDVVSFRALAEKMWQPFIATVLEGKIGVRDFARLMIANRALFQSERLLVDRVVPPSANLAQGAHAVRLPSKTQDQTTPVAGERLPYYAKHMLCAAYLASFNPARLDQIYFMKSSEKKRKRRGGSSKGKRVSKQRKIPRRLLTPSSFPLERLLAIFQAILPRPVKSTADMYTQIATLTSLRLLVRAGLGAVGGDVLDASAKWRVNVGWDYAVGVGRSVGFEISEWCAE